MKVIDNIKSMKKVKGELIIGTLMMFIIGIQNLNGQEWRFPNCDDLIVTKIEESPDNPDKILITVYNECDTCGTHVYTGLKLYRNVELLAVEDELYTKPSPENNDEYEYTLIKMSEVEITNDLRIEMVELCDSIQLSLDIVSGEKDKNLDESKIEIYPNPSFGILKIKIADRIKIEKIRIVNFQGQIIAERQNTISGLNVSELIRGLYVLEIKTNRGIFQKKIIKN